MNRIIRTATLALGLTLALGVGPLFAQDATKSPHVMTPGMKMDGMKMDGPMMQGNMPVNDAAKAYAAANMKMHENMTMEFTGDADVDFMRGMIPHHQGAIDMAEIELKYGKNPQTRKLAKDIIAAQKKEIAFMKSWLTKHAKQ